LIKLLIATPAYGDVFYTPYVSSVLKLARVMNQRKWDFSFITVSHSEIAESRNYLLSHWFDRTDASHILFIDTDMGFEPQLIVDMVSLDKPVVGVIYPKRSIDFDRVAELAARGEPASRAVSKAHQYVFRPLPRGTQPKKRDGFLEVDGCGAGIMLIQRSCIESMLRLNSDLSDSNKINFPLVAHYDRVIRAFDVMRVGKIRFSEDYSFCYRWRHLCGGEIWVSQNHEVVHVGLHPFKARYSDSFPGVTTGRFGVPKKS
jgi:hypothetical protein